MLESDEFLESEPNAFYNKISNTFKKLTTGD